MALYKESMINKIEDDLAGRNQNWAALDDHIAIEAVKTASLRNGWTNSNVSRYGSLRYYEHHGRAYITGVISGANATNDAICTFPVNIGPATRKVIPLYDITAGTVNAYAFLFSSGELETTSRSTIAIDYSYRVGD